MTLAALPLPSPMTVGAYGLVAAVAAVAVVAVVAAVAPSEAQE